MVTRKNDYFKQQFFLEKIDANNEGLAGDKFVMRECRREIYK